MVFVIHPGSEIDAVGVGAGAVVARHEGPEAVDLDGLAVSPLQLAKVVIGLETSSHQPMNAGLNSDLGDFLGSTTKQICFFCPPPDSDSGWIRASSRNLKI